MVAASNTMVNTSHQISTLIPIMCGPGCDEIPWHRKRPDPSVSRAVDLCWRNAPAHTVEIMAEPYIHDSFEIRVEHGRLIAEFTPGRSIYTKLFN